MSYYQLQYYYKNKEKRINYQMKYYKMNEEKIKQYNQQYYKLKMKPKIIKKITNILLLKKPKKKLIPVRSTKDMTLTLRFD